MQGALRAWRLFSEVKNMEAGHHGTDQESSHLATFDALDFEAFSKQRWDRLTENHSEDIVVHRPDGHETRGLEKHVEDLKGMFAFAPDTRISSHPTSSARGNGRA